MTTDDIKTLVAEARGFTSGSDPANARTALINDLADTIDHLKTQKDILWQGLNEAKTHIEKAEQERDDARSANGDLLNRINELAAERDEARSQRVAQEQRAVDLAGTLERARQGRDLEQLALTRAVRQIADLQQELSRLRRVAEVAATFNLGETFRELPGDREVFGS